MSTFGHQRFPALTPFWERATAPGIYFVGSTSQGAPGLKRFGRASNSGVVNGFRHNARVLADRLAVTRFELPARGPGRDVGLQPLTHFLDSSDEPAVAVTVETDPEGTIRPVVYLRGANRCSEHPLETAPLLDFRTKANRASLHALLKGL